MKRIRLKTGDMLLVPLSDSQVALGHLKNHSAVNEYHYNIFQPHVVETAGANSYADDQNGNMISRTVDGVEWTYTYNAENQLTRIEKNSQLVSEYGYDGDGRRVWAIDYESSVAQKETIYIGNYFEFVTEVLTPEPGAGGVCTGIYYVYLPMIFQMPRGVSYYYADGQRIAMRDNDGMVNYLYGDQLGSVSAVADTNGNLVNTTLYEPWGTTRYENGDDITAYGYTGQMQEGDIYFYQSRWYDPDIGRFMQADTIVPLQVQGTQAFDRYAYVNNNPLRYTDPSGNRACDDYYGNGCNVISPPSPNPIFNISVCGLGDSALFCGQTGANVPLSPYLSWNGQHHSFFVQGSSKADTSVRVVDYLRTLPTKAKIRFIGHSAGADSILLVLEELLNTGYPFTITDIVLLDTSLSGAQYGRVGDMLPIVNNIIDSSIPMYIVTTTNYPMSMPDSIPTSLFLPGTESINNPSHYTYANLADEPGRRYLSHSDLALNIDIASMIWSWLQGR